MDDYAKETTIAEDRVQEFAIKLKALLKKREETGIWEGLDAEIEAARTRVNKDWEGLEPIRTLFDDLEKIAMHTVTPYPIGDTFTALNHDDYSLIRDGLITIGAEANTGKSSLLTALSLDLLEHNADMCFLFYSLDDGLYLSGKRILSQIRKMNLFKTQYDPKLFSEVQQGILKRIAIKESLKLDGVLQDVQQIQDASGCSRVIIGVDYLQIIPNETTLQTREYLNKAVKQFKEYQKALEPQGCILFLLSQLNRDTSSTTFRYRETSEIENQSDVCLDIYHLYTNEPNKDTRKKPLYNDPTRTIKVTKNKLGRKGREWRTEISDSFNFTPLRDYDEERARGEQAAEALTGKSEKWSNLGTAPSDKTVQNKQDGELFL